MKTCIWCKNPRKKYFTVISPSAGLMLSQYETEYRENMANTCNDYKEM